MYTAKKAIEDYLNIQPQFWYIFQDQDDSLLDVLYSQDLVIKDNCYKCQYIQEYHGKNTITDFVIYQNDGQIFENKLNLISFDDMVILDKDGNKIIVGA